MTVRNDRLSAADSKTIESQVSAAVTALRSGDRGAFEILLDPDGARASTDRSFAGLDVISVRPLQIFGNSNLAFATVEVAGSSDRVYGLRHLSFIFRKRADDWRILQLDRDAILANAEALFHGFDEHMTGDVWQPPPPAPVLAEPADNAQLPLPVSRYPELAWTGTAASFLIEMQMNVEHVNAPPPIDPNDLTDSFLRFSGVPADQRSYRITAPFGVNAQPYRVRIWALDPSGQTSFSGWHAIYFNLPPRAEPG